MPPNFKLVPCMTLAEVMSGGAYIVHRKHLTDENRASVRDSCIEVSRFADVAKRR